jgi:hypothetical protein
MKGNGVKSPKEQWGGIIKGWPHSIYHGPWCFGCSCGWVTRLTLFVDLDLRSWPWLTLLDFSVSWSIFRNSLATHTRDLMLTRWRSKVGVDHELTDGPRVDYSSFCRKCTKSSKTHAFAPDINLMLVLPKSMQTRIKDSQMAIDLA